MSLHGAVAPPLVLVTVGSDHHPFHRLVDWVDDWLAGQPQGTVRCVIQYGTSHPPRHAEGRDQVPHGTMEQLMQDATLIVTQGGPMSIVEARRAGKVPIVVPRDSSLGEHVDDHQQAFCRRLDAEGMLYAPADESALHRMLSEGLARPDDFAAAHDPDAVARVEHTVDRWARLVNQLVPSRPGPRVLFVAGSGRSGSTLLERTLATVPGVAAIGESVHLWERGVRDNELCGCGQPFGRCPFWQQVGEAAFGGWARVDVDEVVALRHTVVRTRHLPGLLGPSPRPGWRLARDHFARLVGALLRGVQQVSGAEVVVDSSKMPAYAGLLRWAGVDMHCAEIVRDPRGVAFSLAKKVRRPEVVGSEAAMHRTGAAQSAAWWTAFVAAYRLIGARVPLITVRYEDFVNDPRETVRSVLGFAGLEVPDALLTSLGDGHVQVSPGHQVAGNPMRFLNGRLELRIDNSWRSDMPRRDRRIVEALTMGARHLHGYR